MKIMVLADSETFTSVGGCKMIEVDDRLTIDEIEEHLEKLPEREGAVIKGMRHIGTFDTDGRFCKAAPKKHRKTEMILVDMPLSDNKV